MSRLIIVLIVLAQVSRDSWGACKSFLLKNKHVATLIFVLSIVLLLVVFLSGCAMSDVYQKLDPEIYYKHDLTIWHDGETFDGPAVLQLHDRMLFKVISRGEIDLIKITTCAGQFVNEPESKWLFRESRKKFKWTYKPNEIAKSGSCTVRFEVFEKDKGRHGWTIIDFRNQPEKYKLDAEIECNGQPSKTFKGVSICQSFAGKDQPGLVQSIKFKVPVNVSWKSGSLGRTHDDCRIPIPKDNKNFIYQIPNRECYFTFKEIGKDNWHRHTSIGYEDVAIRGND